MQTQSTTRHPNQVAMSDFLAREIAAAGSMSTTDALDHLDAVDARLVAMSAKMTAPGKTPSHLEGLSAWDFLTARNDVTKVKTALQAAMFTQAVA